MDSFFNHKLVLASSSSGRLKLLEDAGITPDFIDPPEIDETVLKKEKSKDHSIRIAKQKMDSVINKHRNVFIITADTAVSVAGKILDKSYDPEVNLEYIRMTSGKRVDLYSSVCVARKDEENFELRKKTIHSVIRFKRMSEKEILDYNESKDGYGCSGGFSLMKKGALYIKWIKGSYSNIVGLPLYETGLMLKTLGYKLI